MAQPSITAAYFAHPSCLLPPQPRSVLRSWLFPHCFPQRQDTFFVSDCCCYFLPIPFSLDIKVPIEDLLNSLPTSHIDAGLPPIRIRRSSSRTSISICPNHNRSRTLSTYASEPDDDITMLCATKPLPHPYSRPSNRFVAPSSEPLFTSHFLHFMTKCKQG